jgi:hypothetical protein
MAVDRINLVCFPVKSTTLDGHVFSVNSRKKNFLIMKRKIKQFYQYQQNKQPPLLILTHWTQEKTVTYDVFWPNCFPGQIEKCFDLNIFYS